MLFNHTGSRNIGSREKKKAYISWFDVMCSGVIHKDVRVFDPDSSFSGNNIIKNTLMLDVCNAEIICHI